MLEECLNKNVLRASAILNGKRRPGREREREIEEQSGERRNQEGGFGRVMWVSGWVYGGTREGFDRFSSKAELKMEGLVGLAGGFGGCSCR